MIRKMIKSDPDFHIWQVQSFYDDYEEDNESDENSSDCSDDAEPIDPKELGERKRKL